MNVEKRMRLIRLSQKMSKNPSYAKRLGLKDQSTLIMKEKNH